MRGGILRSWRALAVSGVLLGGCQSIIGISDYEIDAQLDENSRGGNSTTPGAAGQPDDGEGGSADPPSGGSADMLPDGDGDGGDGGAGGRDSTVECTEVGDCDDTIDCTVDACDDGICTHLADDSLCVPDPGECLTCRVGIGCVAGPAVIEQLLLDPSFDQRSGDWIEDSDSYPSLVVSEPGAQSGMSLAKLGPAPVDATEEEYGDLYQHVTIPEHTSTLELSGYYELTPGAMKPGADYVAAALYELSDTAQPATLFHRWSGSSAAQTTWKSFGYAAPRNEVLAMRGREFTFDLVLRSVGSEYRFDTLRLEATICE